MSLLLLISLRLCQWTPRRNKKVPRSDRWWSRIRQGLLLHIVPLRRSLLQQQQPLMERNRLARSTRSRRGLRMAAAAAREHCCLSLCLRTIRRRRPTYFHQQQGRRSFLASRRKKSRSGSRGKEREKAVRRPDNRYIAINWENTYSLLENS